MRLCVCFFTVNIVPIYIMPSIQAVLTNLVASFRRVLTSLAISKRYGYTNFNFAESCWLSIEIKFKCKYRLKHQYDVCVIQIKEIQYKKQIPINKCGKYYKQIRKLCVCVFKPFYLVHIYSHQMAPKID